MARPEVIVWTRGRYGQLPEDVGTQLGTPTLRLRSSGTIGTAAERLSVRHVRQSLPFYRELFGAPLVLTVDDGVATFPDLDLATARDLLTSDDHRSALGLVSLDLLAEDLHRAWVYAGKEASPTPPDLSAAAAAISELEALAADRGARVITLGRVAVTGREPHEHWLPSDRGVEILRRLNSHAANNKERALFREMVAANFGG